MSTEKIANLGSAGLRAEGMECDIPEYGIFGDTRLVDGRQTLYGDSLKKAVGQRAHGRVLVVVATSLLSIGVHGTGCR